MDESEVIGDDNMNEDAKNEGNVATNARKRVLLAVDQDIVLVCMWLF